MAKLTLGTAAAGATVSALINTVNANSDLIETAVENTLSRDGTSPNSMSNDLDMNSNQILNLPAPVSPTDPIRLQDAPDLAPTVLVQTTAPATTFVEGSLWIDSDSTNTDLYQLVSSAWVDTGVNLKGPAGSGATLSDGDYGDITVSGTGTVFTVDNDAITYAKIQNISATDRLLGRSTAGAGDTEEIVCTAAGRALLDDASASDQRTTLGLGTLATQSGTFSGTSSGTNTGDQNLFGTISVSGQSDVIADSTSDTLTLAAGANITITTVAGTDTITIAGTGGATLGDGDYGDITVSGTGTVMTIDPNVVTYAKMQDVSVTDRVLGRSTAGAGDVEEIACTAAGRALIDDADASAQRTTLGLGTAAVQAGTTGALVGTTDTQTLTNKTLTSPILNTPTLTVLDTGLTVQDNLDTTKQMVFQLSGITTATTRTLTAPDANTTLVGTDATQTLTNKTIDLTSNTLVGSVAEFNTALEAADFYTTGGTDVALADGGTGASLVDPNADRILFWDDSAGAVTFLAPASNLTISGTDLLVTESMIIAVGDEITAITTGTAKVTFRMPYAFTLTEVRASLTTASSSGIPTVDINEAGTTILSTKLTIDANETTSTTAAVPPVISDASLADDASMTIDIDVAGTGAAGLKVYLIGRKT